MSFPITDIGFKKTERMIGSHVISKGVTATVFIASLTSSSLQQIPTSPRAQIGSKMAHVMTGLQTITDVPILQLSPCLQVRGYLYQVPTALIVLAGFKKAHVMIGLLLLQIKNGLQLSPRLSSPGSHVTHSSRPPSARLTDRRQNNGNCSSTVVHTDNRDI